MMGAANAQRGLGCLARLQRVQRRPSFTPATLGGDKGFFSAGFIEALLGRGIASHIAVDPSGHQPARDADGVSSGRSDHGTAAVQMRRSSAG
jgi:hypothetical protein